MKADRNRKKSDGRKSIRFGKIAATVLAVSSISAGVFGLVAEVSAQAGANEMEMVPTSYHVPAAMSVPEIQTAGEITENTREAGDEAEGKRNSETVGKKDYHISMSSMNKGEPTSIDLTMEEAAAFGVKYLEDIMGLDAAGMNVYMMYNSGTVTFPRAFWHGDVRFGEEVKTEDDTWSFFIDAVTGELFMISCAETLDVDVPLAYDASLEDNYGVYAEAAKEVAERCDLVGGPVADVKYGSQGYGGNNPDITMEVTGSNGQMAILTFSRYNQRLLGIITDTSNEISEKALEDLASGKVTSEDVETITVHF